MIYFDSLYANALNLARSSSKAVLGSDSPTWKGRQHLLYTLPCYKRYSNAMNIIFNDIYLCHIYKLRHQKAPYFLAESCQIAFLGIVALNAFQSKDIQLLNTYPLASKVNYFHLVHFSWPEMTFYLC
jgi:hypothetical protein